MHPNAILIFARQPAIHRSHAGEPFASLPWDDLDLLFSAVLSDVVMNASKVASADVILVRDPLVTLDRDIMALGERLHVTEAAAGAHGTQVAAAIHDAFGRGYSRLVVVLENQPMIGPNVFERYFAQLHHEHECVVAGPAVDGRWYLLGMKADYGGLFEPPMPDPLSARHELLRRMCGLPAEMFVGAPRFSLDSGYNLQRLFRELESVTIRDSSFPQRTFDVFRKFEKKYRLRRGLR